MVPSTSEKIPRGGVSWFVANARVRGKLHSAARLSDICALFQQLTTMIRGSSQLLEAIMIAGQESESLTVRQAMQKVAARVSGGQSFSVAASATPEVFEEYWCQLIRTGEASGNLPGVLEKLVVHLETATLLRQKVLGAMAYPCVLIFISVVGLFVMMWKVLPTFTGFLKDFGGTLPAITQFVMRLSEFFGTYGLHVLAGAATTCYLVYRYVNSPTGRRNVTNVILVLPAVGDLAVNSAMQRFTANLALLLKSGTPLLEALEIVQSLFNGFPAYHDAVHQCYVTLSRGADLASCLGNAHLFTPLVCSMVRVGEETGELTAVLEQLEKYYAQRVSRLVETVVSLVEPMVIIFMGVVVGGLLASLYIPMFKISSGARD